MNNADKYPCKILYKPHDLKYKTDLRIFQFCPTIAVTKCGRIYAGWYAGGLREPHMDNYNCLVYSDDQGKSWSDLLLVIPSSHELMVHALDIQLYTDDNGFLHVCWVQNNVQNIPDELPEISGLKPRVMVDGYLFDDFRHCEWEIVCQNPDENSPLFSYPKKLYYGFLRCKPLTLSNGNIIAFNYSQLSENYDYSISFDNGNSFENYKGSQKIQTMFDESMAYQMEDGTVRMFARTMSGELAESYSYDYGYTWTKAILSGIIAANSRFYVKKLPSGRVLLILNADKKIRTNMTLMLSDDDGKTWGNVKCIDTRKGTSYPDADIFNDIIYLTYDRGRESEREIVFCSFTENDIVNNNDIKLNILSKPKCSINRNEVIDKIVKEKYINVINNDTDEKMLNNVKKLCSQGVKAIAISFFKNDSIKNKLIAQKIKYISEHFIDKIVIGAADVSSIEQVYLTKLNGGSFAISSFANEKIIKESYRVGLVSIARANTPTEVQSALTFGADLIEIFPSNNSETNYINNISLQYPDNKFVSTVRSY